MIRPALPFLCLAVALAACDGDGEGAPPSAGPAGPDPGGVPSPGVEDQTAPASAEPSTDLPWRWYRRFPEGGVPSLEGIGVVARVQVPVVHDPRTYVAHQTNDGLVAERLDAAGGSVWRTALAVDAVGAPIHMAPFSHDEAVFVATRLRRGGTLLVALGRGEGDVRYRANRPDPAPAGAGEVQLGEHEGSIVLYVRREGSAHLDVVDATTGALRGRRRFGLEVIGRELEGGGPWTPGEAINAGRFPADGGGHYEGGRLRTREGELATRFRRVGADGGELWSTLLDVGGPFVDSMTVAESTDRVFVTVYGRATSGCVVRSYERDTGALRWEQTPYGIGSIGHSRYGNAVASSVDVDRWVLVRGTESGGSYLSIFAVGDGQPVSNEIWR